MTFGWLFFRTHERQPMSLDPIFYLRQTILESFGLCQQFVLHNPVDTAIGVFAERSKLFAQIDVINASVCEGLLYRALIELWGIFAVRN
jgi:hypothetical protein